MSSTLFGVKKATLRHLRGVGRDGTSLPRIGSMADSMGVIHVFCGDDDDRVLRGVVGYSSTYSTSDLTQPQYLCLSVVTVARSLQIM